MHLTIERMRTLVLLGGALLVVVLVAFLTISRFRNRFNLREIPRRLGANIQQEANGVTYTQSHGGHTLFKIHASKAVQLKQGGRAILHDVQIELYGPDGTRQDSISGDQFEYDQKNGIARAAGPVEITVTRPQSPRTNPPRATKATPLKAAQGEMNVKTSGLTFDEKTGVATTAERVEFAITQGKGSSIGATFDSQNGRVILNRDIELDMRHGPERLLLHANHAEFERDDLLCRMQGAEASFRGGKTTAAHADVLFRPDGSAARLDASDGFSILTATSSRIAAPRGTLEFDEHNQPRQGRLEGGATLDSSTSGRQVHGAAPSADLAFTADGLLQHAHLERGVTIHSDQATASPSGEPVRVSRDWRSPVADAEFRSGGKGRVDLASVTGTGGVVITTQTQRGTGPLVPSRMAADRVTATFGPGQTLSAAIGSGHAILQQTAPSGATQTTSGDRIEATFGTRTAAPTPGRPPAPDQTTPALPGQAIESATVEGNVVFVQQPSPARPTATRSPTSPAPESGPLRATAGRAIYQAAGEWLHLTDHPRVDNGALQLTADKLDVSQGSGDAFAHGNVKATWFPASAGQPSPSGHSPEPSFTLGGQGPAHVIAADAELQQSTGQATFRGQVRLWQQANSISAPLIVLDKSRQTLVAHATSAADPVRVIMLSAAGAAVPKPPSTAKDSAPPAPSAPAIVRVRGGDLKYSEAERKAIVRGGSAGNVIADTGSATVAAGQLELLLLPPGNHAAPDGGAAQVDRVVASGNVTVSSQGRRGAGDRLVYSSQSGEYVLTGSPAHPPTFTDPDKGRVTGASLIFNSRDDSVSIEGGGGQKTVTETIAPK